MAPATVAPSGGTLAGLGGVDVVGESVVRLNVGGVPGAHEVCLPSIPARKQTYRRQIGAGQTETRECRTCDRGGRRCQEVLRIVGIGRLILARLVQVTVVLSCVVRVPRTGEVRVRHALVAALVERARRALAVGAYLHVVVVGLGAPATGAGRPDAQLPSPQQAADRAADRTVGAGSLRCFGP